MIDFTVVNLSRLQFALTALYHFLFVPLTLGMSMILVIMESVYVMIGREIYRDMTRFWGLLFGINFVMGVTTGLTLEFQFGTNWAYFSHYVGDVFGVPLAVEGLMAFILESTFVGLFFFGWERLTKVQHLMVTFLVALGSTGVQPCIERAVRDLLNLIVVFPVEDETHWTDKKGNVLPDAFLVPRGATAKDLAFRVHTDLGKGFIRAINARTRMVVGHDYSVQDGDVIKIVAKA